MASGAGRSCETNEYASATATKDDMPVIMATMKNRPTEAKIAAVLLLPPLIRRFLWITFLVDIFQPAFPSLILSKIWSRLLDQREESICITNTNNA